MSYKTIRETGFCLMSPLRILEISTVFMKAANPTKIFIHISEEVIESNPPRNILSEEFNL